MFNDMKMRQRLALIAFSIASLLACHTVQAQKFPSRPVRVIVAAPPGTSPDLVARLLTSRFPEYLSSADA